MLCTDMIPDFLAHLNNIAPLSTDCLNYLQSEVKMKVIPKGQYLLREGEVCNKLGFVYRGCLKSFILKNDKEKIIWFWLDGDFATSTKSFFEQSSSNNYIQALQDTQFLYITHAALQYVYARYPESNVVARIILQQYYVREVERAELLQQQTALEKYQYLTSNHPNLFDRITDKDIASYLGISPYRLSHLRSQLRAQQTQV